MRGHLIYRQSHTYSENVQAEQLQLLKKDTTLCEKNNVLINI